MAKNKTKKPRGKRLVFSYAGKAGKLLDALRTVSDRDLGFGKPIKIHRDFIEKC